MTNNLLILIRKFCKALLQHLPDFKGIETIQPYLWIEADILQHLPDFKGIETLQDLASVFIGLAAPP